MDLIAVVGALSVSFGLVLEVAACVGLLQRRRARRRAGAST